MEAARVSALRGHKVTLWEKENALGGNLIPASVPDFKGDYKLLRDYLSTQLKKLGVSIELKKEATLQLIQNFNPNVVFIATGSTHIIPNIEGIEKEMKKGRVITAVDALLGKKKLGGSIVVIGGGLIGCETALYLAQNDKEVTIVEILDSVARDMVWGNALDLIKLLDDHNVRILTNTRPLRITEIGIHLANQHTKENILEADSIVLAVGMKSADGISAENLMDKVMEVYTIGDCVKPRRVLNAMWEGYRTGRLI